MGKLQLVYRMADRGCTEAQFATIFDIEERLASLGVVRQRRPLGAYNKHKENARRRGIEWRFTLWTWWLVWDQSGKWAERGGGAGGYVMCRRGDVGAYCPDNVFIARAIQNSSEANRPLGELPVGVRWHRRDRKFYAAHQSRYLGSFDTPEEAYAAYIRASNFTHDHVVLA